MTLSINTNVGALVALRNLNDVTQQLNKTQNRVSTGLRVASAKEDASVFAVAQGVRSDIKAYEAVSGALAGAKGLLSTAISGATAVSNLMADVKVKLTQLADDAISAEQREIYQLDLKGQIDQIRQFLEQSDYNEKNILSGNTSDALIANWTDAQAASVIGDITGGTIAIRENDLMTGGSGAGDIGGWAGLARLAYTTAADTTASNTAILTAERTGATVLTAAQARAALADVAANGSRSTTALGGADSVFNSAWDFFNREVNQALGTLGTDNRFIDSRATFNVELRDAVEEGLGSLVDADIARESARLQALQTRQQLSVQTLSIANQAPTVLLSLFQ